VADTDQDALVEHPTWFGVIRYFFTAIDIEHMGAKGIDLGTYDGVVANALSIYAQTSSGNMPLGGQKWSKNRVQSFLNWITDKFPLGVPSQPSVALRDAIAIAPRLRKELANLSAAEIELLKAAFAGVLSRDPKSDASYYAIAGVHWFPAIDHNSQFHCLHHENRFLAWHRLHLKRFEDALRSVPGCGNVTLPFWDITTPVPSVLYQAPFAQYALQMPIGHGYDPLTTGRYPADQIAEHVAAFSIADQIGVASKQSMWEQFNVAFWRVHDNGHVSCGTTMENQDIAAFDPIFWFFHCNLDRLWLEWQNNVGATTIAGFKSTCQGPTAWLDIPALGALPPFEGTAADAIQLSEVGYAAPQTEMRLVGFENKSGNIAATKRFRIDSSSPLSVRIKDIDRAGIPGTFVVYLFADDKEVARQAFFQPTDPGVCPNCSKNAKVSVDFRVDPAKILDKNLSIQIHVLGQREIGTSFPLSKAGNPTVNIRHLVEGD